RFASLREQPPGLHVAQEARLIDRVQRAEAHRDRRELPEIREAVRMRIGGKSAALGEFAPEIEEVLLREPPLEEGARVVARGGVPLEVDEVRKLAVVAAAEKVVVPDLVQGRGGGVARNVAADAVGLL